MRRAAASLLSAAVRAGSVTSSMPPPTTAAAAGRSLGAVTGIVSARSFASDAGLKKTPLYDMHVAAGGAFL
jgi:hypothetical protein